MAERFDLEHFVVHPTLTQIASCRKEELGQIAVHFGITFAKTLLKKELKALAIDKLVEQGVMIRPEQIGPAAIAVGTPALAEEGQSLEAQTASRVEGEAEGRVKTLFTIPRYDPSPLISTGSRDKARLKVRLARLQLEAQEKDRERQAQFHLQLEVKKLEIEADKAVRLRKLQLETQTAGPVQAAPAGSGMTPSSTISTNVGKTSFDVSKHIALVPVFRETEVDSYFGVFECIAAALQWPAEVWSLLLQCKIHGKAQDAIAALSLEESLSYNAVKTAILRGYELVPEAYRQKFRDHRKAQSNLCRVC